MSATIGTFSIPSGVQDFTVPFSPAFVTAPEAILVSLTVPSSEPSPLNLIASVTDKTTVGFSVHLSGVTNSANLVLNWVAGSSATLLQMVGFNRQLFQSQPVAESINDADRLVLVRTAPAPRTFQLPVELLRLESWRFSAVPVAATSPGGPGKIAADASYLYVGSSSGWRRVPLDPTTDWGVDLRALPTRKGEVALSSGVATQAFSFTSPFSAGELPVLRVLQVYNVSADADKMILTPFVTAVTLTGFTIALNGVTPTGNYKLYYEAFQPAS